MPNPWDYTSKTNLEHAHQAALFMWANMTMKFGLDVADDRKSYSVAGYAAEMAHGIISGQGYDPRVPELKWLHAIHNQGHGDAVRGAKAKAEGTRAGVYDMFLPVPRLVGLVASKLIAERSPLPFYATPETPKAACGFYLELKVGKNTTSDIQNEFGADMAKAGYATAVAWGWLDARNKLLDYLGLPTYKDSTS